jgi:SAP domain
MRIAHLLSSLDAKRVGELARAVVPGADDQVSHMWVAALENVLRSTGHVEHLIVAQRPPVLALLITLLETEARAGSRGDLRREALALAERWTRLVTDGEICGGADRCQLYRRLLAAAWGNDLRIDASESHLLGLLRHELGMTKVEHFLISHHREITSVFGHGDDGFDALVDALCAGGVLYEVGDSLQLPDELVANVRRALGVRTSMAAMRRLLQHLGNDELKAALERHHLRLSGAKPERIERLVDALAPIDVTLDVAHVNDLKDLARRFGMTVGGSKDQLIERIVDYFDRDRDLASLDEAPPEIVAESKALSESAFGRLFDGFTVQQRRELLQESDLPFGGAKTKQIETLWASPYSEATLLRRFSAAELEAALEKLGLDRRGNKEERASRLIAHHGRQG